MSARVTTLAVLLTLLTACGGKTPQEQAEAAQAALNSGDFSAARTAADAALATDPVQADKALTWRFEKLRLDALAGLKQPAEILASLQRLSGPYAAQVDAPLYAALCSNLQKARDYLGAIDVVHAGIEKFPAQKAKFEGALASLTAAAQEAAASGDNASLERLRSLGYL